MSRADIFSRHVVLRPNNLVLEFCIILGDSNTQMSRCPGKLRRQWKQVVREQGSRMVELVCLLNGENTSEKRLEEWNRMFSGLEVPRWLATNESGRAWSVSVGRRLLWPRRIPPNCRSLVKDYVGKWIAAGKNAHKLFRFEERLRDNRPNRYSVKRMIIDAMTRTRLSLYFQPTGETFAESVVHTSTANEKAVMASWLFVDLLTNPFRDLLCGPCKNCKQYFLNRSGHKDAVYCRSGCREASKKRTRRQKEHADRVARARAAMDKLAKPTDDYGLPKYRGDWKQEVARQTSLTTKWLTRAINNRELHIPRPLLKLRHQQKQAK